MTRLLTFLVLTSCVVAAALLAFSAIGWVSAPTDELVSTMIYAAATAAGILLLGGLIQDVTSNDHRAVGIAMFLTGLWFALAPAFGSHDIQVMIEQIPPGLVDAVVLVIGMYLVVAGRLALRNGTRPLGLGLVVLASLLIVMNTQILGGPTYPTFYYVGLGAALAAFASMLVTRPDLHDPIAWTSAGAFVVAWIVQAFL